MDKKFTIVKNMLREQYASQPFPDNRTKGWRHIRMPNLSGADSAFSAPHYTIDMPEEWGYNKKITEPSHDQVSPVKKSKLRLMNEALWSEGLEVSVNKNADAGVPITITVGNSGSDTCLPRVFIRVDDGVDSTIVIKQHFKRTNLVSSVLKIWLGQRSRVGILFEVNGDGVHQFNHILPVVMGDAKLELVCVSSGGALIRSEIKCVLLEAGSEALIRGFTVARGNSQHIADITQTHAAANTTSDLELRAVVADTASSHFNGLVRINELAHKSSAYQKNANLMLSSTAKVYTTPELEIKANDVRCTHGATSGPHNREQLFYLKSRGLSDLESSMMLTESFALAGLPKLHNKHLRRLSAQLIRKEMNKLKRAI